VVGGQVPPIVQVNDELDVVLTEQGLELVVVFGSQTPVDHEVRDMPLQLVEVGNRAELHRKATHQ